MHCNRNLTKHAGEIRRHRVEIKADGSWCGGQAITILQCPRRPALSAPPAYSSTGLPQKMHRCSGLSPSGGWCAQSRGACGGRPASRGSCPAAIASLASSDTFSNTNNLVSSGSQMSCMGIGTRVGGWGVSSRRRRAGAAARWRGRRRAKQRQATACSHIKTVQRQCQEWPAHLLASKAPVHEGGELGAQAVRRGGGQRVHVQPLQGINQRPCMQSSLAFQFLLAYVLRCSLNLTSCWRTGCVLTTQLMAECHACRPYQESAT